MEENKFIDKRLKIDRIGEQNINNQGELMEIISYINANNIVVKFLKTGGTTNSTYRMFKSGNIKDGFYPSVVGHGYLGNAKTRDSCGNEKKSYKVWHYMIVRCYSEKVHSIRPTYTDCSVCDEWLCYENFEKWFDKNYYTIENEKMTLDKDILFKGNKIYSPDTCVFVPERINTIFVKHDSTRGKYPVGVSYDKEHKKFRAYVSITTDKGKYDKWHLGFYDTIEGAFTAYKKAKEMLIKQMADKYKDKIPKNLYNALCKYKVEATD